MVKDAALPCLLMAAAAADEGPLPWRQCQWIRSVQSVWSNGKIITPNNNPTQHPPHRILTSCWCAWHAFSFRAVKCKGVLCNYETTTAVASTHTHAYIVYWKQQQTLHGVCGGLASLSAVFLSLHPHPRPRPHPLLFVLGGMRVWTMHTPLRFAEDMNFGPPRNTCDIIYLY